MIKNIVRESDSFKWLNEIIKPIRFGASSKKQDTKNPKPLA